MSEKNDYQTFKNNIIQFNDRCNRVENMVFAGMPDINICINGIESWIELKHATEPKRHASKLFADNHKLNIAQINWHLAQHNANGRSYILIGTNKRWLLIRGANADCINAATVAELKVLSIVSFYKPVKDMEKWVILRSVIAS